MADSFTQNFAVPPVYELDMFALMKEWFKVSQEWLFFLFQTSDTPYRGFVNIPYSLNCSLLLYIAIFYLKCHVVFHGIEYNMLPWPLTIVGRWLFPVYRRLSELFPDGKTISFVDDESLFAGAYNFQVQVCMSIVTILGVCNHHCAFCIDLFFLGISAWHVIYLYRNNMRRLIYLAGLLVVVNKGKHLVITAGSWMQFFYLLAIIYVLTLSVYCALPDHVNLDVALFYFCVLAYIAYINFESLYRHGTNPPESGKEQSVFSSWLANFAADQSSAMTDDSESDFEWMPMDGYSLLHPFI